MINSFTFYVLRISLVRKWFYVFMKNLEMQECIWNTYNKQKHIRYIKSLIRFSFFNNIHKNMNLYNYLHSSDQIWNDI